MSGRFELCERADLVVAHNVGFDRPFCEAFSSMFSGKAWARSVKEVDRAARGFEGTIVDGGMAIVEVATLTNQVAELVDCRRDLVEYVPWAGMLFACGLPWLGRGLGPEKYLDFVQALPVEYSGLMSIAVGLAVPVAKILVVSAFTRGHATSWAKTFRQVF
ncbi:hypothetical protein [Sinorhizobium saheli]|uniref:Exonuclease domain-containing protein n=1 Tax=Sinorhizobium saheli TaxID=36856 RepID=A0A178YS24_SINSA|nr:hypothetical protein [Sinorhizobium saheli]OAP50187.1 hypothetical protein ATB98_24595 [Sinorhizobium saheli]